MTEGSNSCVDAAASMDQKNSATARNGTRRTHPLRRADGTSRGPLASEYSAAGSSVRSQTLEHDVLVHREVEEDREAAVIVPPMHQKERPQEAELADRVI